MNEPADVDAYIAAAPPPAQQLLRELRQIVLDAAPGTSEKISYGMPTFMYAGKRLGHIAAARSHVAVYGVVHQDVGIPDDLASYADHRSTLHFRFGTPLPAAALRRAVEAKARALKESQ